MEEELDFDPSTVICEKFRGVVKFHGSGKYICSECGNVVLDDFGKVKDFLEKRGPSNIAEISYATGLEKTVIARLLMDGRIQVARQTVDGRICASCGVPINRGKYCSDCSLIIASQKRSKKNEDQGKMHFLNKDKK